MGRINADALATLIDRKIIPELRATDARLKGLVAVPDEPAARRRRPKMRSTANGKLALRADFAQPGVLPRAGPRR